MRLGDYMAPARSIRSAAHLWLALCRGEASLRTLAYPVKSVR
jgi:hypothetical protein